MDAPTAPTHTCLYCGSNFTKKFNLKRHMIRIHKISEEFIESNFTKNVSHLSINSHPKTKNVSQETKNVSQETKNVSQETKNVSQETKNVSHTINKDILTETCNDLECNKCGKTFSRKWYLNIHSQKCEGSKYKNTCQYCLKVFSYASSFSKHNKICKAKKETESKSLIPLQEDSYQQLQNIPVQPTISGGNTLVNCNHNNIVNNSQNVNIIVYDKENMEFVKHHIDSKSVDRILNLAKPHINRQFVTEYSKQIFSNPENQCIKKGDLKSGHSEVHIGDDQWELDLDCNIYPKLACNMASTLSDFLYTKRNQLRKDFDKIIGFLDYIADEGYVNTDDKDKQEEIFNEYKIFVKELKLIIYSATQKMKQPFQEQKDVSIE
jgi:hypothetical protein